VVRGVSELLFFDLAAGLQNEAETEGSMRSGEQDPYYDEIIYSDGSIDEQMK
jgi:hypothetical protein